jgi:voltage-gated potassium channel
MTGSDLRPKKSLIDRRVRRIANARSVTVGLALTFLALSFVAAIVIWIADHHDFPSLGLAVWWALQTVTTVGYGDVVPTTTAGRVVGGVEMLIAVSFIAFLTAGVTSTVVQRGQADAVEADRSQREGEFKTIVQALEQLRHSIVDLDMRLDSIESRLRK